MNSAEVILRFVTVLLMLLYLYGRFNGRQAYSQTRASGKSADGHAFDASSIAPKIQHVRANYLAARERDNDRTWQRERLVALARSTIRALGFFCHKEET